MLDMTRFFKLSLFIIVAVLFAAEWVTSQQLRDLGDRTTIKVCYRLAETVDTIHDKVDSFFTEVQSIATERIERWRNIAKNRS